MERKTKVGKHYSILKKAEDISFSVIELIKEDKYKNATPETLKELTKNFKQRLHKGESLDDILIEAFATAYRAVQMVYGINLYRVQIMGGYALHRGDVAEMKTGEGKTLTAILPAYLNALTGKGVHIVTVNEYLSTRDALNTGRVFSVLGLKTGSVISNQSPNKKREEYNKDITYLTNSELGFDYLRDNLVKDFEHKTQRKLNFAIVDEVDSILIDEARTPLIISGGSNVANDEYIIADDLILKMVEGDYDFDKETNQAFLTQQGAEFIEKELKLENLYSFKNSNLVHRIHNALQAHFRFKEGVDYTVKNDEIVLIDIFTGRLLEGRQYSNGLNQAIEAKERIKIKPETKTYASITYQNLFRMYKKLSGMSGTAVPEEEELSSIYNMRVIPIPTNRPIIRVDLPDLIFSTAKVKFEKIIERIIEIHKTSQPILVGTRSVNDSEMISERLTLLKIKHEVLNAKNHSREAEIIAKAGKRNSITISTNMAGRGTDIKLGDGVVELGGLYVIGSERHESRRIDDQLRGRSGRQGDVGITQFMVSLEDEIMQRAGLKRIKRWMGSLDEMPIQSKMIAKSLTIAQKKLEGINYDARKSVIEYDDVLNQQRLLTYQQRDKIFTTKNILGIAENMLRSFVDWIAEDVNVHNGTTFISEKFIKLINFNIKGINLPIKSLSKNEVKDFVKEEIVKIFKDFIKNEDQEELEKKIKNIMIHSIDTSWQNQIERLDRLKNGIHYRQYAQKNPVQAYVLEADKLFNYYRDEIKQKFSLIILRKIYHDEANDIEKQNNRETKEILIK
ncbi:MAG: protein translocase subunit SecA [Candidatus Tyloplasma litorale]|nr:MAG: protein translocase subunit SecA [Mycoplasmatales bacterium]